MKNYNTVEHNAPLTRRLPSHLRGDRLRHPVWHPPRLFVQPVLGSERGCFYRVVQSEMERSQTFLLCFMVGCELLLARDGDEGRGLSGGAMGEEETEGCRVS